MSGSMERWRGEVALVTGASSGIGRAIAARLAREGLKVAALARRAERLGDLAAELAEELTDAPGELWALPCDLRDEAAIAAALAELRARWGGVRVLVNNAGMGRKAPLLGGATADWREMLELNVLALCVLTREATADMRAAGDWGQVIHVSSMSAHRVPPGGGVYSATKHAVKALTEGLRLELREAQSGVRVASLSPGFVETEFAAVFNRDPAAAEQTYGQYKVLESEDVAESLIHVLAAPPHVQIHDLLLRPRDQPT